MNALILVDIQNDFVTGGALAVPEGEQVVSVANRLMERFDRVVATQDFHPTGHRSFASRHEGHAPGEVVDLHGLDQVLWPDHCVQGTNGADFVEELNIDRIDKVFPKGTDSKVDSYSGFFDNGPAETRRNTGLGEWLREQSVEAVCVVGLATDYCVKATALHARELGFETTIVFEGVRGVELNEGDCQRAIEEMEAVGVRIVREENLDRS